MKFDRVVELPDIISSGHTWLRTVALFFASGRAIKVKKKKKV